MIVPGSERHSVNSQVLGDPVVAGAVKQMVSELSLFPYLCYSCQVVLRLDNVGFINENL